MHRLINAFLDYPIKIMLFTFFILYHQAQLPLKHLSDFEIS